MTAVVIINIVLASAVLGTIMGLMGWSILTEKAASVHRL